MGRKAKPLQEQLQLLQSRGMHIADEEKARHILLEVGWYRMSFYWFPFETRYPNLENPHHEFRHGTAFEDALELYAFDFNLRHLLLKPLERIETAFRTYLIYRVSTHYPHSPAWFADKQVVRPSDAAGFERAIYNPLKRQNPEIQRHHRRFPHDKFAPAWKTLEFMTLGTMCNIYSSLQSSNVRRDVARHFGVHQDDVFEAYMGVIRGLRNVCAHGNILYAFRPSEIPAGGPALGGTIRPEGNLHGALSVMDHFLGVISERVQHEYRQGLAQLLKEFSRRPATRHVLTHISGFPSKKLDFPNHK